MSSGPSRREIVVIGGGISGLAAAHAVAQASGEAVRVTVLDKSPILGGHLRLAEVAGIAVDAGAESLLSRRPEAVELARAVGLGDDLEYPAPAGAGLWSRGKIAPLPARTLMGVPSDPDTLNAVLTPDELGRARTEPTLPGMPVHDDVAVGKLVGDRMGPAVTERLVEPFLGGVFAGRAEELSLRATVPALAAAAAAHSSLFAAAASALDPARDDPAAPVFAAIRGGVGRLPAAVTAASGAQIRTRTTARTLSRLGGGWRVETGPVPGPGIIDADAVIVAVPASPAARILRDAAPVAAVELAQVEYASVAIVTLAFPSAGFPERPRWSGFLVPPVDGHRIKAVTFSSVKWPWMAASAGELVVSRASIGRHRDQADLQCEDGELVSMVLTELEQAIGPTGQPVDSHVMRWGGALPQYAVGHVERISRVFAAVDAVPGLAVCGAAYDGVGVAACVAGAQRAATAVLRHLGLVPVSAP